MTRDHNERFDAGAYWANRVGSGADLGVVGHRSMGHYYNGEIYARRVDVLTAHLNRHTIRSLENLRILDIGCGSGFYTDFWERHGVSEYVGFDISPNSVDSLSKMYPRYKFLQADIAVDLPDVLRDAAPFDVITVFDVLYHIVDDRRFESAISNIASLVRQDGCIMVMDHLCQSEYQLSKHVRYRARHRYLEALASRDLMLIDSELLFHYLVPPITEIRFIDYLLAGAYRLMGLASRRFRGPSIWIARKLRRLDDRLRSRGTQVSNNEFFVFSKRKHLRE